MKQRIANRTIGPVVLASALAMGGISCVHAPLKEPVQTSTMGAKGAKGAPQPRTYELLRCSSTARRDCPEELANNPAMVEVKQEFCRIAARDANSLARDMRCGPRGKLQYVMELKTDGNIELLETKSEGGGCTAWPAGNMALKSVGNDVRLPASKQGCRFSLEAYFMEK